MATDFNLVYNHQTACQRLPSAQASRRSLASPYPPVVASTPTSPPSEPSQSQGPPVCDLFATLLFNRSRAYQSRFCVPSALSSAPVAEAGGTKPTERNIRTQIQHRSPIPSNLHVHGQEGNQHSQEPTMVSGAPIVGRKRARPAMQTSTKDAGKTTTDKPRKQVAPARVTRRSTRIRKPVANITKEVDDKGNMDQNMATALTTTSDKDIEIITISDSEDDEHQAKRKGMIGLSKSEDMGFGAPKIRICEDDEDDVKPIIPTPTAEPERSQLEPTRSPFVPLDQVPKPTFGSPDALESESDIHPGPALDDVQNDMSFAETEHTKEKLILELSAAKTELEKITRLHEKRESEHELMQVRSSNIARQETKRLQQEVETERSNLRIAMRERDQLRIDIGNSKAKNDQLARELREEKRLRQLEKSEHEAILKDVMRCKQTKSDSSNNFLVTENGRLRIENECFRAATQPPSMPQSAFPPTPTSTFTPSSSQLSQVSRNSPYPSIFTTHAVSPAPPSPTPSVPAATTEERKDENIRKVYLKVRRRFNALQLAAVNLTNTAKGMDLSNFGQFGKYLRQLKTVLDEDVK